MSTCEKRSLPSSEDKTDYSAVLLDIEGTTTAISFVKDTLFPYVRTNIEKYVKDKWSDDDFKAVYEKLVEQSAADVEAKMEGAVLLKKDEEDAEAAQKALVANVLWQMDSDRKAGPLKTLQGHVYRDGYKNGDLKGHVFADVALALKAWKKAGKEVYIYSSGSVEAQKLLFEHSAEGNLLTFIDGHFDTEVGPKADTKSYSTIVSKINKKAEEIIFYTDVVTEAKAAKEAGLDVVLLEREGNAPLKEEDREAFTVITIFPHETEESAQNCKKPKLEEEPKESVKDVEMTEAEDKAEATATEAETAPVKDTEEKSEVEVTEEKPEEKKVEEDGDKETKKDETPAAAEEVAEEKEKKKEEEESTETPHENGVNGTTEKENGHTNGHTNGDTPSGDAPAEVEEEKPKEASPVKKVVSEAKEDAAEEAVTAE